MRVHTSVAVPSNLLGLFVGVLYVGFVSSYVDNGDFEMETGTRSVSYQYYRIDEVNQECAFVLDSAAEMKPDNNRLYSIKEELSFKNGDWSQDLNGAGAPLMPFKDMIENVQYPPNEVRSPTNLVSFWLTDVDGKNNFKKSILVSGLLQIGIVVYDALARKPYDQHPFFDFNPGHSVLLVSFQGIYTESKEKKGERVLCLLGETTLPYRQPDSSDPWRWVKESGDGNLPPVKQDDKILLVLRYPTRMTLTSRSILGSMKSLNPKSKSKYFDEVHISSRFTSRHYEFTADNLVSKACDPYPYKDSTMNGEIDIYKGLDVCLILERFTNNDPLYVLPNWKCNGTDDFCSKLGPFVSDKGVLTTNGSLKNVNLIMQDVRCEKIMSNENAGIVKFSMVFRAIAPSENLFVASGRTGLNNMTLTAEGIWKSSSGQVCMVGCLGVVDRNGDGCDSRICLYVPVSFSIKQRNMLFGTISSIDQTTKSYFPLEFGRFLKSYHLSSQYTASHSYYKYSKTDAAGALLEKDDPFNFATVIRKSLLKFPKAENYGEFPNLYQDLTFHLAALPDPFPNAFLTETSVALEILFLRSLFGSYQNYNFTGFGKENPHSDTITEKQLLLNVSCQLNLFGETYNNFSSLSVEGIYNPQSGKMYLIGCRDVRASWKIFYESMDLEAGLDCLVKVIVSYPPTSSRWLVDSMAMISISSLRNEDDPLYFIPIKLQTGLFMYARQREDILSRRGVEGILRVLTLSVAVAWILSQLFYIKDNTDSVPFISLVMLGIQALGYSLPLITGAEALFKKASTMLNYDQSYELRNSLSITITDYPVKLLVLVAFSLTLRLCQKVWRSRIRMLTRAPLEPHRVPSDRKILFATLIIHAVGYIIVHYANASNVPSQTLQFLDSMAYSNKMRGWEFELEEYLGLVQDFFLLPQVIANLVWQIHRRPLRKTYYIGITAIRLLPHLYNGIIAPPIPIPYFYEKNYFADPRTDFYSKYGDIAIPITAVFLALVVYVQQRWNYAKLSEKLVLGKAKLLPVGSKVYERLASTSCEAELVCDGNKNPIYEKEHDAE